MSSLITVVAACILVVVLTIVVPVGYVASLGAVRGIYLSLRAFRVRRKIARAGGPSNLSDDELSKAISRVDDRLSFRPLFRNPSWVPRYAHLKEQLDLVSLSREAAALSRAAD